MVLGYFKYNIRVWRLPCPACPLASAQVIDEEKIADERPLVPDSDCGCNCVHRARQLPHILEHF